jgi:RNA polymerase sigma-70 factor (ECF subfamily)
MSLVYLNTKSELTPHETLVAEDIERDFKQALEELPVQCRKIFELSRFDGYKYQEIAEKLNISIKTVETQMSRALFKIRTQLKDHLISFTFVIVLAARGFIE